MKFKQINRKFYDAVKSNPDKRYYVFYGGAGSGKSIFVIQWLLTNVITEEVNILILRQWREAVKESVIEPFKQVALAFGISWDDAFHKTDRILSVNKSRVVFGGMDNVEKYKGTNWDYIWIEEATDITENDLNLINLRLGRDSENAKFVLTFNPVDANHWIIKRFIEKQQPDAIIHHSTYLDNYQFLSKQFVDQLKDLINKDENLYRVYTLGIPGVLTNIIYSNWHVEALLPDMQWHCAGLDFGYNNPSSMVYIQQRADGYNIHEVLYQSGMTNTDLIAWLREHHPRNLLIYADSAEPQRIEEIRQAGFLITQANKSVKDGIDFCKAQTLLISPQSDNLLKEIRGYKWKELKTGGVIDEPVKAHDHAVDAMRYAMRTHFGMQEPVQMQKVYVLQDDYEI